MLARISPCRGPQLPTNRNHLGMRTFGDERDRATRTPKEARMPRGDKSTYTGKQQRKAEHIEESYESRGVSEDEAERRAWATVNKQEGGGKKGGSGSKGARKAASKGTSRKSGTKKSAASRKSGTKSTRSAACSTSKSSSSKSS